MATAMNADGDGHRNYTAPGVMSHYYQQLSHVRQPWNANPCPMPPPPGWQPFQMQGPQYPQIIPPPPFLSPTFGGYAPGYGPDGGAGEMNFGPPNGDGQGGFYPPGMRW